MIPVEFESPRQARIRKRERRLDHPAPRRKAIFCAVSGRQLDLFVTYSDIKSGGCGMPCAASASQSSHKGSTMADAVSSHEKVIILGSGPAGATAAIYAARAMLSPVMIAGLQPGGQLTITTEIENYPGFAEAIQGPWLMEQMQAQAEHVGARLVQDTIAAVDLARRPFVLTGDFGNALQRRNADHRDRRAGQLAGPSIRRAVPGLRRLGLRHLRRLLLPRQTASPSSAAAIPLPRRHCSSPNSQTR